MHKLRPTSLLPLAALMAALGACGQDPGQSRSAPEASATRSTRADTVGIVAEAIIYHLLTRPSTLHAVACLPQDVLAREIQERVRAASYKNVSVTQGCAFTVEMNGEPNIEAARIDSLRRWSDSASVFVVARFGNAAWGERVDVVWDRSLMLWRGTSRSIYGIAVW